MKLAKRDHVVLLSSTTFVAYCRCSKKKYMDRDSRAALHYKPFTEHIVQNFILFHMHFSYKKQKQSMIASGIIHNRAQPLYRNRLHETSFTLRLHTV